MLKTINAAAPPPPQRERRDDGSAAMDISGIDTTAAQQFFVSSCEMT